MPSPSASEVPHSFDKIDPKTLGWVYRSLGVEPVINCVGVRTNYGASNPSGEVIAAMTAAAEAFVDLDELAEGVGKKMAALTGAEWGVVTAGTASGLALATAACIAGNNPELMLKLPDTSGLRNKVVIPADQRFAYEQAIRVAGGDIVSVSTAEELLNAIAGGIAMICLLGRKHESSALSLDFVRPVAQANAVPILINAAGLSPENPDRLITRGADLVVYAGGKYIRGPQSTGIVLGKEHLCRAMWWNAAPHQSFGRLMKVGKEEAIGAVVALDRWINFQSARTEREQWLPRLKRISSHFAAVPGVATKVMTWSGSVTATRLKVSWDPTMIPFDAEALRSAMLERRPRILIHDFWSTPTSITLDPVNLSDEEAEIVGEALATAFTVPQLIARSVPKTAATVDISGAWEVDVEFLHGSSRHRFQIEQKNSKISGVHHTEQSAGAISGEVSGRAVHFEAAHERTPIWLFYAFDGEVTGSGTISGTMRMGGAASEHLGPVFKGQYGTAKWHATRVAPQDLRRYVTSPPPASRGRAK
ncbi:MULTISPECIES: hypothetical protein [unclassified Sinorhizobium]|uniref:hypothetical protein n=1 Tax=unclassified Sinorhizobium TaxID=2613772 RepID=UPI0024C38A42|nr:MULTISPECIES: hypothetical protein [unclassified Sinorhizobium]MDK1378135.1 hypothetical protein [Sinorhizobium sp. 6-70]MDK1482333.1 hypothetical protein [Sinorhizobium sp. 6-117]